jgi:cell division protein FtsL
MGSNSPLSKFYDRPPAFSVSHLTIILLTEISLTAALVVFSRFLKRLAGMIKNSRLRTPKKRTVLAKSKALVS